jgi:hypothetical protein
MASAPRPEVPLPLARHVVLDVDGEVMLWQPTARAVGVTHEFSCPVPVLQDEPTAWKPTLPPGETMSLRSYEVIASIPVIQFRMGDR